MPHDLYQYAIELVRQDRSRLNEVPVSVDWGPAVEWGRLMALRASRDDRIPRHDDVAIEPNWDGRLGEPYVASLRVQVTGYVTTPLLAKLPRAYFNRAAIEVSKQFVKQKLLAPHERFVYSVVARRCPPKEQPAPRFALTVKEIIEPLPLRRVAQSDLQSGATAVGSGQKSDVGVFMPQHVLDQAGTLTRDAGADETAGVLIGHLCRDPETNELFLKVTDLIPARHTRSESTRVTFTAETWSAVEGALRLRRNGEMMLGWFHSHPAKYWCSSTCSPEARRNCPLSRSWFSGEDCGLHRAVFPMAHSVALVVTHAINGLRHALFGWHEGRIIQRGFHVLQAAPGLLETASGEAIIGEHHEEICV